MVVRNKIFISVRCVVFLTATVLSALLLPVHRPESSSG